MCHGIVNRTSVRSCHTDWNKLQLYHYYYCYCITSPVRTRIRYGISVSPARKEQHFVWNPLGHWSQAITICIFIVVSFHCVSWAELTQLEDLIFSSQRPLDRTSFSYSFFSPLLCCTHIASSGEKKPKICRIAKSFYMQTFRNNKILLKIFWQYLP